MTKKRRAIPSSDRKAYDRRSIKKTEINSNELEEVRKSFKVPIISSEERIVTGIVLQPDIVDGHGEVVSEETIKKAAYRFLADYNSVTRLGLQHKHFNKDIDLLESYIVKQSMLLGNKIVKKGSWIVTVKVNDDTIWSMIKSGQVTGFSIGGRAKARKLNGS